MSRQRLIISSQDRVNFILAGKAVFNLRSKKTDISLRYKVAVPKKYPNSTKRYVYYRMDNEWAYIGIIYTLGPTKPFYNTRKAKLNHNHMAVKAFNWLWYKLIRNENHDRIDVIHSGRCGRCGRPLVDPLSIERGLGPVCRKKVKRRLKNGTK